MGLLELAERCERATGPDRVLMCSAFKAVFPEVADGAWDAIDAWDARYDRFCTMLDAGAHENAALMLVPEEWTFELRDRYARVIHPRKPSMDAEGRSPMGSPALALTAACLRALAAAQPKGQRDG